MRTLLLGVLTAVGWTIALVVRLRWCHERYLFCCRLDSLQRQVNFERMRCDQWRDAAHRTLELVQDDRWRETLTAIINLPEVEQGD